MKIKLLLPAGGARGVYQVGFLSRLLQNDDVEVVEARGISVGSYVAPFAITGNIDLLKDFVMRGLQSETESFFVDWPFVKIETTHRSYEHPLSNLFRFAYFFINLAAFADIRTDLLAQLQQRIAQSEALQSKMRHLHMYAVDIETGALKHFDLSDDHTRAHWIDVVRASTAAPGVLPPVCIDQRYYVDGAVINTYPFDDGDRDQPDPDSATYTLMLDFEDQTRPATNYRHIDNRSSLSVFVLFRQIVRIVLARVIAYETEVIEQTHTYEEQIDMASTTESMHSKVSRRGNFFRYSLKIDVDNPFVFDQDYIARAFQEGVCAAEDFISRG